MNTLNKPENHIIKDLLTTVLLVSIAFILQDFLIPVVFALILSVLIFPVVKYFETHLCFNRIVSITVAIFLFTVVIIFCFILIGIQFEEIMSKSDAYFMKIGNKFTNIVKLTEDLTGIRSKDIVGNNNLSINEILKTNSTKILNFITASGSIIGDFVLSPLYMFLFLLYRNFLISFLYKFSKNIYTKQKMRFILKELYKVQQNYLLGMVSVMFIVGLLNSIGLLILGIEHAFFFGFLCALLLLIPYIGIIIGSLLPALIALATKDSYWYAVGVIAVFGFIQFIEGNFITPKITGSKVSLNPLVSILVIVLFSMLWGIPGMILALPITASLKVVFDNSEKFKSIGFVLGEVDEKYFSSKSNNRLKTWIKLRKKKSN